MSFVLPVPESGAHDAGDSTPETSEQANEAGRRGPRRWIVLTRSGPVRHADRPVRLRGVLLAVGAATAVVVLIVAVGGTILTRRMAEQEAVQSAARTTDLLATNVIQPELRDKLAGGDPSTVRQLDQVVRTRILGPRIVRVKLWNLQGRILYSDEPRLVGRTIPLDPEAREALLAPTTQAAVTDLREPENEFERSYGKLLEVHRPVLTHDGQRLLLETYSPYGEVNERTSRLWRGFAGITLTSLLLAMVLLIPLIAGLVARLQRAQRQRETLLLRAVEASSTERRRIAATIHDGVVQELAATSLVFAGKAARPGRLPGEAEEWRQAADIVRADVGALRSSLVDIYPASLHAAGLSVALSDLADTLRGGDITIKIAVDPAAATAMSDETEQLAFSVAQECLRNAVKHSHGRQALVRLTRTADNTVDLEIVDDGVGFDVHAVLANPEPGHLGVRLLTDRCTQSDGILMVTSEPGNGTAWKLTLPAA